jgi:hypothetical protein
MASTERHEQKIGKMWETRKHKWWTFQFENIREAAKGLGIEKDIGFGVVEARDRTGAHRPKGNSQMWMHSITVKRDQSPEEASKTIWHELAHAAQTEEVERVYGDVRAWDQVYRRGGTDYGSNVFERDAFAHEDFHQLMSLAK